MNTPPSLPSAQNPAGIFAWRAISPSELFYRPVRHRPPVRTLLLSCLLFLLTLCTCLAAGAQFAAAYAHNQAVSFDEFVRSFLLLYRQPSALLAGLPFALTLLGILLAHELGHVFACRHHHIRASYPFFIPAPTLIGTFGAFILIRSPIRTTRALFDVGASGPLVGFVLALPALAFGVLHAKIIPGLAANSDIVFGVPLVMRLFAAMFHPDAAVGNLLIHPVGRAAWVGLFATSLNLLPAGQLDGGHILRSFSPRGHHLISLLLPFCLLPLGFFLWHGWFVWAALLFGLRFLRTAPVYDSTPLDPDRKFGAILALLVFILCFMPSPV